MKTKAAIRHYGSARALARALDVSTQAIAQWGDNVPPLRAYQIEVLTTGKLRAPRSPSEAKRPRRAS